MRAITMNEQRRHKRLDVTLPIILRYQGRLVPATMLNLSCGGARIRAEEGELVANTPVEITFDLDNQIYDVSMRGNIIHTTKDPTARDGYIAGVQFAGIVSDSQKAIEEYLKKHLN